MEISVANRQRKVGISSKHARLIALSVLEGESACFDEISIAFLSEKAMCRLNRMFTGRAGPTDTLAFELLPERVRGRRIAGRRVGEVIVCVERAMVQSRIHKVSPQKELARLLVHGLLHLCGFSDTSGKARERMRRREDYYMTQLRSTVSSLVRLPLRGLVTRSSRGRRF